MTTRARTTLILGGARSGKSRIAEDLTLSMAKPGHAAVYIATAQAFDTEMYQRINAHRERRGGAWSTIEESLDLPAAVLDASTADTCVLVDCLTLWLSNLMHAEHDIDAATDALIDALARAPGPIVLVSNEVGQGIVPDNALARRFRDLAGVLHQRCAAACDSVLFVTAGLVQTLKEPS